MWWNKSWGGWWMGVWNWVLFLRKREQSIHTEVVPTVWLRSVQGSLASATLQAENGTWWQSMEPLTLLMRFTYLMTHGWDQKVQSQQEHSHWHLMSHVYKIFLISVENKKDEKLNTEELDNVVYMWLEYLWKYIQETRCPTRQSNRMVGKNCAYCSHIH